MILAGYAGRKILRECTLRGVVNSRWAREAVLPQAAPDASPVLA